MGLTAACGGSSRCDPAALDVTWTPFTDAAGLPFDCAGASAVGGVRVLVDGTTAFQLDGGCVSTAGGARSEGTRLTGLAPGAHEIAVQGIGADGLVRFEDRRTVTVPAGCAGAQQVATTPAAVADDLGLTYSIAGQLACPVSGFVWLSMSDETRGTVYAVVDQTRAPTSIPCGTPLVFPAAPFGRYRVDFIQIVTPTGIPTIPFRAAYQMCVPFVFDHAADDVATLPALQQATGPCAP